MKVIARATGIVGLASVLSQLIGFAIVTGTDRPLLAESADRWSQWASQHRTATLVAIGLLTLGYALTVAFLVGLRALAADDAVGRFAADAAVATGLLLFAVMTAGLAVASESLFRAGTLGPDTSRALSDVALVAVVLANIITVVTFAAISVSLSRNPRFPRWAAWLAAATALVHIGASFSLARRGFFSPDGPPMTAAPLMHWLWLAATGIALLRSSPIRSKENAP